MKKVLFVCTGNTCRSPMAMALFNDFANKNGLDVVSDSGGLAADVGSFASENTISVLEEMNIDLSGYKSKQINNQMLDESDLIVCMSQGHRDVLESVGYSTELFGDGINDPYGCSIDVYRNCRDKMIGEIPKLLRFLK